MHSPFGNRLADCSGVQLDVITDSPGLAGRGEYDWSATDKTKYSWDPSRTSPTVDDDYSPCLKNRQRDRSFAIRLIDF